MTDPVLRVVREDEQVGHDAYSALEAAAKVVTALDAEAKELRRQLRDSEGQRRFLEGALQGMSHHIVRLHENFDARLTDWSIRAESRFQEYERRLAEVGALADRLAQEQTAANLRDPADNDDLADQIEAHRDWPWGEPR